MTVELTPVVPAKIARKTRTASPQWRRAWRSMVRAKWPLVAVIILLLVAVAAILGPWLAPLDPICTSPLLTCKALCGDVVLTPRLPLT